MSESKKADDVQRTATQKSRLDVDLSNISFEPLTSEKRLERRYPDDSTIASNFSIHFNPHHVDQARKVLSGTLPTHAKIDYNLEVGLAVVSFTEATTSGAIAIRWNELFTTFDVPFRDALRLWNVRRIPAGKVILVPTRVRTDMPGVPVCLVLSIAGRKLVESPRVTQPKDSAKQKTEKVPPDQDIIMAAAEEPEPEEEQR